MKIKKKTIASIVLSIALVVVLGLGALSLGGCTKKNANQNTTNNGNVTTTTNKNGGVTLETSATVKVDIPKGK